MFYRISLSIVILSCCISCSNESKSKQPVVVADTLAIVGYIIEGKTDSAISICNSQLDILKASGNDSSYVFLTKWMIGKMLAEPADYKTASFYYKNIFLLADKPAHDTAIQKEILNSYYQWAYQIGFRKLSRMDDSSILILEKCIPLQTQLKSLTSQEEKDVYMLLGILYNIVGDTRKSLYYYDLQASFIQPGNFNAVAGISNNRAIALMEMGQADSAINIAKQALKNPITAQDRKADLITILSMVETEKKLYADAGKDILISLSILDTFQSTSSGIYEKKARALKQKGILERLAGQPVSSVSTIKRSIEAFLKTDSKSDRSLAKIYTELGKSYEAAGFPDSALSSYHTALSLVADIDTANLFALPASAQLYTENTIMEALDAEGNLFATKFEQSKESKWLELSLRCYLLSFEVERKLMQNFSYDESRLIMLKVSKERSEKAISICYRLKEINNDTKWAEMAYVFAQKSKSFVLLESIKRNIAANSLLLNDTLYQKMQSLQATLSYIERKLIGAKHSGNDSLYQLFLLKQKNINKELLLGNNSLVRTNTSFKLLLDKEDSISLPLIQNKWLDDRTALLEFFAGDSSVYIFLITKNSSPVFVRVDSNFSGHAHRFLSFFTDKNKINNDPAAYQAAAYDLYKNTPIATVINNASSIKKLLIIPDGILNTVPFEALLTSVSKEQSPVQFHYLLNDCSISYGYSVSTLIKQMEGKPSKGSIVGMAPVFSNNERDNTPLQYSAGELEAIRKEIPSGKYFFREDATFSEFKKNINSSSIIHIASHAHADTTAGTQPRIEFYDSTLYLNELYTMQINPRLVVLSACETGIGILDKSEGAMSLARGFYYAGAKNIITSLWSVDDKSTATLFSSFYANTSNNNYSAALHESKLEYIKNASVTTASPYYWAGFVHIGYEPPVKKKINFMLLTGAAILLALLSFLIYLKRRK
jgi:CHAT domain-containing protein